MINIPNPEQLKGIENSESTESGVLPNLAAEKGAKPETLTPLSTSENTKVLNERGVSAPVAKEILVSADTMAKTAAEAGGSFDSQRAKQILSEILKGTRDVTVGNETDTNNISAVADALIAEGREQMKKHESAVN